MSGEPSSSTAITNIRRSKILDKRPTKTIKKDDTFTSTVGSINLNKMMGTGSTTDKQKTIEEKSKDGVKIMLHKTNERTTDDAVDILASYVRQLTREALVRAHKAAEHADRNQIEVEDVNLIINSLMPKTISRAERGEMGKLINAQELPKIRNSALHLPVDRCCIIQPEYSAIIEKPREEEAVPSKIPKPSKSAVDVSHVTSILKNPNESYD